MIVRTFDGLQALTTPQSSWSSGPTSTLQLYGLNQAYAHIYATQPNVRICVDFLSRNIAELAPQVFRRVSDTDRVRLVDHDLARWLEKPNPSTSQYRLFESLIGDMGVYFNAGWLKVRYADEATGRPAIGLVRLPADQLRAEGGLLKQQFVWTDTVGRERAFPLSEIVWFDGYNPTNPLMGLSPLETLRNILAEEAAAAGYRQSFWTNAGRAEGIWEIAKDAPAAKWTKDQQKSWREQWQEFAGGGSKAGMTALGPSGGSYKQISFNAKDSEYVAGGKLRREVCAAAYHIPLPLVGILEHATFSNIREQHKHLYQDCLGPWLKLIVQELKRQLLVESDDQDHVYVEFNIDAKLAGTPEERAASLRLAIGRPWRTVNEGRALENLPRLDDPELDTVAPQQGGPSDATANPPPATDASAPPPPPADDTTDTEAQIAPILHAARLRQQARLSRVDVVERAATFYDQIGRWNEELAADLTPILGADQATMRAKAVNDAVMRTLLVLEAA